MGYFCYIKCNWKGRLGSIEPIRGCSLAVENRIPAQPDIIPRICISVLSVQVVRTNLDSFAAKNDMFSFQLLVKEYEQEIKSLKMELAMHDTLVSSLIY